ncbi:MAG: cytochrome c biogenesis protein CcdA [Desulfovibrio sp.]|uniref:protein-disulfide reductase DsbD family protein n=1 Tax=Desulfovibrio sp. 7SRBS1 TaxID=3378064 RepID=UPI003B40B12F
MIERKNNQTTPSKIHTQFLILLFILPLALCLFMVQAHAQGEQDIRMDCQVMVPHGTSTPNALLRVRVTPPAGYYLYANDAGAMGLPTVLTATLRNNSPENSPDDDPTGAPTGPAFPVRYPKGKKKSLDGTSGTTYRTYPGPTDLYADLPANSAGKTVRLSLSGLLCSDTTCLPVSTTTHVDLPDSFSGLPTAGLTELAKLSPPHAPASPEPPQDTKLTTQGPESTPELNSDQSAASQASQASQDSQDQSIQEGLPAFTPRSFAPGLEVGSLGKAALLAFLAGLILNFMPCVLPVASLKLKGILTCCDDLSPRLAKLHFRSYNIWFAAGILSYFLLLSIVFSSLGLAWGEIFQTPSIVLGLCVVVFAMSLSLFGVFSLPIIDLKSGPQSGSQTPAKAFFTGVMATLLATPCSGPFLGGVLAWVLLQPPLIIAVVFLCIGFGMASPYLFMAARPHLLLPFQRPGAWTGTVEKLAAFLLAGTCLYLLTILPSELLLPTLSVLLVTAFAAWMWGGWTGPEKSNRHRMLVRSAAVILLGVSIIWALAPPQPAPTWKEFDETTFLNTLGDKPILAEFTADWCPNCIFNEKTVLTADNLNRWKKAYGLELIKVDLTENDPQTEALLHSMNSRSIPLLAIFPTGKASQAPLILRDLYTASDVDKALDNALTSSKTP